MLLFSAAAVCLHGEEHLDTQIKTESFLLTPLLCIPKEQCHVNNRMLTCPLCTFVATKHYSMDLHKVVHTTEKPYHCAECEYGTSHTGNFNGHILTHNNDRPYSCTHCNSVFTVTSQLKRHMRSRHPNSVL